MVTADARTAIALSLSPGQHKGVSEHRVCAAAEIELPLVMDALTEFCWNAGTAKEVLQMSKYGIEGDMELTKAKIARLQLEDAIELFLSRKWISPTTLAGAAEGIFAGMLKVQGELSPAEEAWEDIEKIRAATGQSYAGERTKKDAFREWNERRNTLKHHNETDEDPLTFNPFDDALEVINRANVTGDRLGVVASNREAYENWIIENVFLMREPS